MALSKQVEESLREAESNLRNALSFAARTEKPFVTVMISNMIRDIDSVIYLDNIHDKFDNLKDKYRNDQA